MQKLLPPYCFMLCLITELALHFGLQNAVPQTQIPLPWKLSGIVVLFLGIALLATGSQRFTRVRTNFHTFMDPNELVTSGPFRVTRNPMYLGFTLILTGQGSSWALYWR